MCEYISCGKPNLAVSNDNVFVCQECAIESRIADEIKCICSTENKIFGKFYAFSNIKCNMILIVGVNLKNEFYWDYITYEDYLDYEAELNKISQKTTAKRVLYITKCEECNHINCKYRQMCGTIPEQCPLSKV